MDLDFKAKFKNACVGVAGLGGLGSNVTVALVRAGVKKFVLADFDVVEESNLNRQVYFREHLGMYKTEALLEILRKINPCVDVKFFTRKIMQDDIREIFSGVDVLVEAFDKPDEKAMLVNTALTKLPDVYVVAASGIAGFLSSNSIVTRRKMDRLYVVGDEMSEADSGAVMMGPRVGIAGLHQANMVLRILLGEYDV